MSSLIGQRIHDSAALPGDYIKVPSAASAPLRDARPLDASTALIFHNNLAHLAAENVRHLALWQGAGVKGQIDGWGGLTDAAAPDSSAPSGIESQISWDRRTAVRFGPFCGVQDRRAADGRGVLRRHVVEVDVTAGGGSSLTLYVAITAGMAPQPPWLAAPPPFVDSAACSTGVKTMTIDVAAPLGASEAIASRPSAATFGAVVTPVWYWVWVGWKSTIAGDQINAISVYETRD